VTEIGPIVLSEPAVPLKIGLTSRKEFVSTLKAAHQGYARFIEVAGVLRPKAELPGAAIAGLHMQRTVMEPGRRAV
jgi:hypothetical protein